MTSPAHGDLAYWMTKYYFGDSVAAVVRTLFCYDQITFRLLRHNLPNMKAQNLKRSLLILVKYQMVDYVNRVKDFNRQFEYSITPQRIFYLFRAAKYIEMINEQDGDIAGIMVAILSEKALLGEEKLIKMTEERLRLDETKNDAINESILRLRSRRILVNIGSNLGLNLSKLNREHRDSLVADAIYTFYSCDSRVKTLCQTLLELSLDNTSDDAPITAPVPLADLMRSLVPSCFQQKIQLERYISFLISEKSFRFFLSGGSHPHKGPMYALDVGKTMDYLVKEHICSVITTRFGPKCCRVFRVLLQRGPLLLRQIEEFIMLPARDVREYSYMLIKEGFIRNRQVPKTPDNAPGKSVFIMSVELDHVVYNLADLCCRSSANLLMRNQFELERNKSLLDRSKAIQKLLKSEKSIQDGENTPSDYWNQYFTSHELNQLNKVNRDLDKVQLARAQADDTLSILHFWLQMRPNMEYGIL